MASATLTFSQLRPTPNAIHVGMTWAAGALSRSATVCASSVLNMVQVPNGATLLDFWLRVHTGGASQNIQIGTSNTPSGIMSITTLSQTFSHSGTAQGIYGVFNQGYIRAPGGTAGTGAGATQDLMPVRISLSDDVQPASVWVQGRLGAGCSESAYFTFVLFYSTDGAPGHTTIR